MIRVENLRKEFKNTIKEPGVVGSIKSFFHPKVERFIAVNDISFHIPKGEIFGFIGPNGAGKSTVVKMLTGILTPTSGICIVNGKNPTGNRKTYARDIGVVFGQRTQLWWDLALRETYCILKEIYEIPDDTYHKKISFLNEVLDLDSFICKPVRTLSLGQRMRADIAASLLHSPKVLFLDEPTIGLDVVVKEKIRKAIAYINEQENTTIVLTTHDLMDIELLSNHIVMIDKGVSIFDGTMSDLKNRFGKISQLFFETENDNVVSDSFYREHFKVDACDFFVEVKGTNVKIRFSPEAVSVAEILSYTLQHTNIKDINICTPDIEEIICNAYVQK